MRRTWTREEALSSVGLGWASIINRIYDNMPEGILVNQVKEKFGGLRFYYDLEIQDNGEDSVTPPEQALYFRDVVVQEAESDSYKTCEDCGSQEQVTTKPYTGKYWIVTLCEGCRKKVP